MHGKHARCHVIGYFQIVWEGHGETGSRVIRDGDDMEVLGVPTVMQAEWGTSVIDVCIEDECWKTAKLLVDMG